MEVDLSRLPVSGTPLAEVFSVVIHADRYKEIYGTIEVQDDKGTLPIFDVESKDAEIIEHCDSLSLSNTDRAISACDRFTIHLDLKDGTDDSEFIKESFSWDSRINDVYDTCLVEKFNGNFGSATVYYIVHSVAIEAIVVSELQSGDSFSGTLDIYGSISGRYKMMHDCDASEDRKKHSCMIIDQKYKFAPVEMEDEQFFPLTRSIVSVPAYSSLLLEVKLRCCLPGGIDKLVWSGEVEFLPIPIFGQPMTTEIKGIYGVVKLSVVWLHYYVKSLEDLEFMKKLVDEYGVLA